MSKSKIMRAGEDTPDRLANVPEVNGDQTQTTEEPKKPKKTDDDKVADFRRLALKRVPKVLKGIKNIANLANVHAYSYTAEQADHIVKSIQMELDALKRRFVGSKDATDEWTLG